MARWADSLIFWSPEHLRTWRAGLFGFDPSGVFVLVEVSVTCLMGDSAMRSRGEDMRDRVEALIREAEMKVLGSRPASYEHRRATAAVSPL